MVIHYMYWEDLFFKKTIMIYLFIYLFLLAVPQGTALWGEVSSSPRFWTCTLALEAQSLNHYTAREVPIYPYDRKVCFHFTLYFEEFSLYGL